MALAFVNLLGESLDSVVENAKKKKPAVKRAAQPAKSFHNGWRVTGLPPGSLEAAKASRESDIKSAIANARKIPQPFDSALWLATAKQKPVRSKPYELVSAAIECKSLAEKAGWLNVQVQELKQEVQESV